MSKHIGSILAGALLAAALPAGAATADEAAKLKGELTPLGGERAGNRDGSIPAWNGGFTTPIAGDKAGGRRGDPFKDEKPVLTITAKNAEQYAERLTDGTRALLKKYPDSFRVDVYKTHRTAAAPQWVYQNTLQNATRGRIEDGVPRGVYGGIPFPVPKTGEEVMWNHMLHWRGTSWKFANTWYQLTADGRPVQVSDTEGAQQFPYYYQDRTLEDFQKGDGVFWTVRIRNIGPAIRAGEALLAHENLDPDKLQTWVYLTGQRRVRKLPNACCDAPTPAAAGVMSFDEIYTWTGRLDRFNWKILGKKEMYIPYNNNRFMQARTDAEVLGKNHYNPDHMRWELHRVWVVEASLRPGQRHQAPRSRYYCDEDTWICVLGDRWDASGQLWKTLWSQVFVAPDMPGLVIGSNGFNDLLSGAAFVGQLYNAKPSQVALQKRLPDSHFSPEAIAGESLR
ncbi:DUF1329 domain-containing protein [Massilia niastensis]|uniref:DUF1329 domain-containing protein n=1 Tax=Massilia niastensis TaxID=544911 RepID=UPI00035D229A|nr:DUF1329 domain-containing protein [Massilia niastensis]